LNNCEGQDTVKKNIKLYKESYKIDSLISRITKDYVFRKSPEKASCFLLNLNEGSDDNGFIMQIRSFNNNQTISEYAYFLNENRLGYFEFNGVLIFVYGDQFMNQLLKKTKNKKEFTFIKSSVDSDVFVMTHFMQYFIFYDHGDLNYGVK